MLNRFNKFLNAAAEYLAHRKGLLPMIGILLVVINGVLQFVPTIGWMSESNILLHLGVIIAILGIMLAWAL